MKFKQQRGRFILIFVAGISLLTGLWSGLARMGWALPMPAAEFAMIHGPLMVVGFLGTLIGLERAVALGRVWPYGIPILAGLSSLSLLISFSGQSAALLAAGAGLLLIAAFILLYRQYPSEHFVIMGLSALCWLIGSVVWLREAPLFLVVPWWVGFLVLMIAGERLELSRIRRPPARVRLVFHLGVVVVLAGLVISSIHFTLGVRGAGVGLLIVAAWLLRYDMAWQSLKQGDLPRFMALCLIAGYVWLALGSVLWIFFAPYYSAGAYYDAMLHAIFLGFVFSMIFAHGPIILPIITGLRLPFQNIFYLHAGLLHLSLILRTAGDLGTWVPLQRWGGLLNGLAIVFFLLANIRAVKKGNQSH